MPHGAATMAVIVTVVTTAATVTVVSQAVLVLSLEIVVSMVLTVTATDLTAAMTDAPLTECDPASASGIAVRKGTADGEIAAASAERNDAAPRLLIGQTVRTGTAT